MLIATIVTIGSGLGVDKVMHATGCFVLGRWPAVAASGVRQWRWLCVITIAVVVEVVQATVTANGWLLPRPLSGRAELTDLVADATGFAVAALWVAFRRHSSGEVEDPVMSS